MEKGDDNNYRWGLMRPWASFYLEHGNNGYKEPEILMKRASIFFSVVHPSSSGLSESLGTVSLKDVFRKRSTEDTEQITTHTQHHHDGSVCQVCMRHFLMMVVEAALASFANPEKFDKVYIPLLWNSLFKCVASGVYTPINNCKVSGKKKVFKISPFFSKR